MHFYEPASNKNTFAKKRKKRDKRTKHTHTETPQL